MSGSDTESKTKPASARKLRKLREEGNVAQATDAAALAAAMLAIGALWGIFAFGIRLLRENFDIAFANLDGEFVNAINTMGQITARNLTILLASVAAVALSTSILITVIYNGGFLFSTKPLVPKADRISPKTGFKRIYGLRGWLETATAVIRITIWVACAILIFWFERGAFISLARCGESCGLDLAVRLLLTLSFVMAFLCFASAGADMLLQRFLFQKEQMMTEGEAKREQKEQVGSPEIRRERKRLMRAASRSASAVGVNKANMCFYTKDYAIAVRYHPERVPLPRISASAKTPETVEQMRHRIANNGFPELHDPILIAGCRGIQNGSPVPEEMYRRLADGIGLIFRGRPPA